SLESRLDRVPGHPLAHGERLLEHPKSGPEGALEDARVMRRQRALAIAMADVTAVAERPSVDVFPQGPAALGAGESGGRSAQRSVTQAAPPVDGGIRR